MTFYDEIGRWPWEAVAAAIAGRTRAEAERALAAPRLDTDGLLSLLSPAAAPLLEEMAQRAHRLTLRRFGRVMGMFAPLYLSNVCTNRCLYCGFNAGNAVARVTLTPAAAAAEGEAIRALGFRHVLLLTGEAPAIVTPDYLKEVLARLRPRFSSIGIEMFPMAAERYRELAAQGVDSLTLFQETYREATYGDYHPAGRKRDYRWRLEGPERGGAAGLRRLGIGALLGLEDWRCEGFFMGLHARYLERHCWRSQVNLSFPRLCGSAGAFTPSHPVGDRELVQLLCALRLFLPDAGFILSTREAPALRDRLIPLGTTVMSAGSRTEPGGYARPGDAEAQFEVADPRSPAEVAAVLTRLGYEPAWKDWDAAYAP